MIRGNPSRIYRDHDASMVKAFKESHEKDVETLAADRRREAESEETHAFANVPKPCDTVLSMTGPTSLGQVWTISIFRW